MGVMSGNKQQVMLTVTLKGQFLWGVRFVGLLPLKWDTGHCTVTEDYWCCGGTEGLWFLIEKPQ